MPARGGDLPECPQCLEVGAYALHALPDEDARAFVAHLTACATCRGELAELRTVVDSLPLTVPQIAPPPALRGRIMAVVDAESELLRAAGSQADRPAAPRARPRWRGLLTTSIRPAWAGALACGLLALGVAFGVLGSQGPDAPVSRSIPAWAKGTATAKLDVTGDQAALELTHLPSLSQGRVYQVWFDHGDGQLRPTHTLFNVRSDGRAKVAIDESVRGVKKILVTAEPSGGSMAPSPAGPVVTAALA